MANPDSGCSEDGYCVRRKSDGAVFLGFSSSCFLEVGERWELCTAEENEDLGACGGAGEGGQGGGVAESGE
jgi:hypothetical protein